MVSKVDDMCDGKVSSSEVLSHVNASRLLLLNAYPMFYPLLLSVKVMVDESERYLMSVTEDGTIFISPRVVNYPLNEVGWVLLHELLHLFYNHFVRGKNFVSEIWELATELEINDFLPNPPLKRPFGVLLPEEVGLPSGKTAEWYYHQLMTNRRLLERTKRRQSELFRPCGGVKKSETENPVIPLTVDQITEKLVSSKSIGNLPQTINHLIVKGRQQNELSLYLNKLEWFTKSCLSNQYRWNFSLPSRRFGGKVKPPRITTHSPTIGVILDISSSMSANEISTSLQLIRGLVSSYHGELRVFVANVDIVREIDPSEEIVPTGGGTSMKQSLITLTQQHDFQGFIVFTDGYTDTPSASEISFIPLLWVLTERRKDFDPEWGEVVYLPAGGELST